MAPSLAGAQALELDHYRPAELASDGFVVSRAESLGHLQVGGQLHLDYAFNPLVYELRQGDADTEVASIVEQHASLHGTLAFGLFDHLILFATLPASLVMEGTEVPGLPTADGAALGDVSFGARGIFISGLRNPISLALQLRMTAPTADAAQSDQNFAGEEGWTAQPELLFEVRPHRQFWITLNAGARFRDTRRILGLEVGHEFTWGASLTAVAVPNVLSFHAEAWGETTLEDFGDREGSPIEALLGLKVQPIRGLYVGAAGGTGLTRGYGSPDLRLAANIGWAPGEEEPQPEPEPAPAAPLDSDGDGILDTTDQCVNEPEDADQFEDENGCPDPDNDGDGVLDPQDQCVNEPEDVDQFEDENGCPDPDNDQDTILDASDQCPLEAEDIDQFEDENGCPDPDNDRDTVLDPQDQCPLDPGRPEDNGCPRLVRVERETGSIVILQRVEFATNQDRILERSEPVLAEVISVLEANPQLRRIRIEGHTDDRGRDARNLDLSGRRARSVVRFLIEGGVSTDRLEAWGCGELHPIETNRTNEGRQINRRVEFLIIDPQPSQQRQLYEDCQSIPLQ